MKIRMDSKTHFILNGEIDKVGIDQHSIRGSQGSVILEEEGRRNIRPTTHNKYQLNIQHYGCKLTILCVCEKKDAYTFRGSFSVLKSFFFGFNTSSLCLKARKNNQYSTN